MLRENKQQYTPSIQFSFFYCHTSYYCCLININISMYKCIHTHINIYTLYISIFEIIFFMDQLKQFYY